MGIGKNFVQRAKAKRLEKYEEFGITFIVTYALTVVFTLIFVFRQFEDVMLDNGISSLFDFFNNENCKFPFYYCQNLSPAVYLAAKIAETLIPTTITFSTSIFIIHTTKFKSEWKSFLLLISLFVFTMVGMYFMGAKVEALLEVTLWILLGLFFVSIILSALLYAKTSNKNVAHKNEPSDGNFIG